MQLTIKNDEQVKGVLKNGTIVRASVYANTLAADPVDMNIYLGRREAGNS